MAGIRLAATRVVRWPASAVAVVLMAAVAAFGLAGTASAHTALIASDPAEGARLETAPTAVSLTFDEHVRDDDINQVAVTGPDGKQWAEGQVQVKDAVATAQLRPLGPAGKYTIGFRILSADGDPVSGEISFTLARPGGDTPAAKEAAADPSTAGPTPTAKEAAASGASSGLPLWAWIAGPLLLLAVALGLAVRTKSGESETE